MKKIFHIVALAALVFGMASCEKENTDTYLEVQSEEFGMQVTEVTEYSVTFDIVPVDKKATFDYVLMPKSKLASFDVNWAINQSYKKAQNGGTLYHGNLKDIHVTNLYSDAEYVIAVYYVDMEGEHDSKEATFAHFRTTGVPVSKIVPFEDQNAEITDYTSTGYLFYDGLIHYGWQLHASCGDYSLFFETDDTEEIAGTYDAAEFVDGVAKYKYDVTHYQIESGRVTVTGTKPYFNISGFLIDSENVRYDLNIHVTKYEIGIDE